MKRDSFIFYRSFFEAAQELSQKDRMKLYDAICELALNGNEIELKGPSKAVFIPIAPQIAANNVRYQNGTKGGRKKRSNYQTKSEPKENQNETKSEANVVMKMSNENVECRMSNENVNVNDITTIPLDVNSNINTSISDLVESEFKRELTEDEYKQVNSMCSYYGEDMVKCALREAIIYDVPELKYMVSILRRWRADGITYQDYINGDF